MKSRILCLLIVVVVPLTVPRPLAAQNQFGCNIELPAAAGGYVTELWPNGIVYYEFHSNVDDANRQSALAAMMEVEAVSSVEFVERTSESNYILIRDSDSNSSAVGMQGGLQNINIVSWNARFIIVHELLHALGLWHEQQRPDRDDFVQIHWGNIRPGKEHNFQIREDVLLSGPYDFDSVMHYWQCAFSTCGSCSGDTDCITIEVQVPYYDEWQTGIGQSNHLSLGDIQVLHIMYGPPPLEPLAQLLAPDAEFGDDLGWAGAIDGATIMVGALKPIAGDEGAVYVWEFDGETWNLTHVLDSPDPDPGDHFGGNANIDIDGDVAIIGAIHDDEFGPDSGEAFIYRRNGINWQAEQRLLAPDAAAHAQFGGRVAIQGDTAIVTAGAHDQPAPDAGKCYVFERIGAWWYLVQEIQPPGLDEQDYFGLCVDIHGDLLAIGAKRDDDAGTDAGAVYIYRFDGLNWQLEDKVLNPNGLAYQGYAADVAVGDEVVAVGAATDDTLEDGAGAVYVYRPQQGQWSLDARLLPSEPDLGGAFGWSVDLDGSTIVVGAVGESAAYVFDAVGDDPIIWSQRQRCRPQDISSGDEFGRIVSISGTNVLVTAPDADIAAPYAGAAFVFGVPGAISFDSGACCLTDGSCLEMNPGDCATQGGDYQGDDSLCIEALCEPPVGDCPADMNADEVVDFNDLLMVIAQWGPCSPECPADIDGDGVVGFPDLLELLVAWGPCS